MASIEGSIQSLSEQVTLQRTRAVAAEAKNIAAQRKLDSIQSVVNYVFDHEGFVTNDLLRQFAASITKILRGET